MSADNSSKSNSQLGFQILSREERELRAKVRSQYFFFNFLPIWIGSCTTLKFLIQKGTIKTKRPGMLYVGNTLLIYIFSKFVEFRQLTKQMKEKFPDGVFAQTSHMNRDQVLEYLKNRELEDAKKKLEAAGMSVVDQTAQIPAHFEQSADGSTEKQTTIDSVEVTQQQETRVHKKTYADLRKQNYPEPSGSPNQSTSSKPPADIIEKGNLSDDPPSKLRTGRKNKYGDEME